MPSSLSFSSPLFSTSLSLLPWIPAIVLSPIRGRSDTNGQNRYLVGEPLCHDAEFRDALDDFLWQFVLASQVSLMFPALLKPLAIRYLTGFERRKAYVTYKLRALATYHPGPTDRVLPSLAPPLSRTS